MGFLKRLFGGDVTEVGAEKQGTARRADVIDAQELSARLNQPPTPFLLDVREPHEFADGHIAGAVLIPLGSLQQSTAKLPRDREIVCVCRSGNRSSAATRHLASAGYTATNLRGGMIGWMRSGLPIQRGKH
ncbi:MAG: rhodanese-like domain-containing protein [Chloroflexi bacterium]|nr:rhodanese-like domain-containing protein [Chloroflexota bacterium]MCL5276057.1 rhodanese-like domain-containing protein [Chloroflexota bacterium]